MSLLSIVESLSKCSGVIGRRGDVGVEEEFGREGGEVKEGVGPRDSGQEEAGHA